MTTRSIVTRSDISCVRRVMPLFEAHTGAAALELVELHSPALVLLDVHLPDVTGYELLKIFRRDPRTHEIGVVIHTASVPTSEGKGMAESLGADGFLTYPIAPSDLLITVRGVMAKATLRRSVQPPAGTSASTD